MHVERVHHYVGIPYIALWVHVFVCNVGRYLLGHMQILLKGSSSYLFVYNCLKDFILPEKY
jgi:hypothetical protein